MKLYTALLYVLVLCVSVAPLPAQTSSYLGVQLQQAPLPALLTKHLQLEPGHGVLVQNILIDGPADKAGLDKDDIIVTFDGQPVSGYKQLSETICAAQADQDVTLGVIQSGQLNEVTVRLEARPAGSHWGQWKYSLPADSSHVWRPGRIFRFDSGVPNIDISGLPQGRIANFPDIIEQFSASCAYIYQHGTGADRFTVSIKGNPKEADTTVTVKAGDDEYKVTIDTIDQLPEKYRQSVQDDIEKSKEYTIDFKGQGIGVPFKDNFDFKAFPFSPDEMNVPKRPNASDPELNKLLEQLEQLKEQLEKRDEKYQQRLDRLEKMLNQKLEVSA